MPDNLESLLVRELGNLVFGDREREAEQRKLLVATAEKSLKEGVGLSPETYKAVSEAYGPDLAGIYQNIEASPGFKALTVKNQMGGAVAQQVGQSVVAPMQGGGGVAPQLVPSVATSAADAMLSTPTPSPIAAASNFGLDYGPAPGQGLPRIPAGQSVKKAMQAGAAPTPLSTPAVAGDAPAGQPFAVSEFSPEASGMFSTAEQTAERPPTPEEYTQRINALPAELRGFILDDPQVSAGMVERGQRLTERQLSQEDRRLGQGDVGLQYEGQRVEQAQEGLGLERRRVEQGDIGLQYEGERVAQGREGLRLEANRDRMNDLATQFDMAHKQFVERQATVELRNANFKDALNHVGSLFGVGTTPVEQKRIARFFAHGRPLPPHLAKKIGMTPGMMGRGGKGSTAGQITPKMLYERMNTAFNAPVVLADSFLKMTDRPTFAAGDLSNRNDIFLRGYVQSTMEFLAGTGQPIDMQHIEDHIFRNGRLLVEGKSGLPRAVTFGEYLRGNPDAAPSIRKRMREFSSMLARQEGAQITEGGAPPDAIESFWQNYKPGGSGGLPPATPQRGAARSF